MNGKILIINPNTYRTPPVIPLGPEYIVSSLMLAGWDAELLDLTFEDDPEQAATAAVREIEPVFAGVSIRNIDTALYQNNIYFMPEIKNLVLALKQEGATVVLGGAGFSAVPSEILDYTGADYGITGPSETAVVRLVELLASGEKPPRLTSGWRSGINPDFTPSRPLSMVNYRRYIDSGGIVGFATQYGCTGKCPYCIESSKPVMQRSAEAVAAELETIAEAGFSSFHLCDSEFNLDLAQAELFAKTLADASLGITWTAYLKPVPFSSKLPALLRKSGLNTITLSVDTITLSAENGPYGFDDLETVISTCRWEGIRTAVDLLTGYPDEPFESTVKALEFFSSHMPETVGINAHFRIYPGTDIARLILSRPDLLEKIRFVEKGDFLAPAFYNHLADETISDIIAGHPGFRIEGMDRNTNYERLSG